MVLSIFESFYQFAQKIFLDTTSPWVQNNLDLICSIIALFFIAFIIFIAIFCVFKVLEIIKTILGG